MARSLTAGAVTVEIPPAAEWIDEFTRSPYVQSIARVFSGAPVVQEFAMPGGDITIAGSANIMEYSAVETLLSMRNTALLSLHWDGIDRECVWRRPNEVTATPLLPGLIDPAPTDLYRVALHLFELPGA